jgi:hypothetical protein
MQRYRYYAPTQFDAKGLALDDRQDWIVVIGHNRDSDALSRSNWRVLCKDADRCGVESEIHRFGHWACGWLEILIVAPSAEAWAEAWAEALDNYPVADDEDLSEVESDDDQQAWESYGCRETQRALAAAYETACSVAERDCGELPEFDDLPDPIVDAWTEAIRDVAESWGSGERWLEWRESHKRPIVDATGDRLARFVSYCVNAPHVVDRWCRLYRPYSHRHAIARAMGVL